MNLRHTALVGAALALTCLTAGCARSAPEVPEPTPGSTTSSPRPSTPVPSTTPAVRLAATPKTQRGEVARVEVRSSAGSGSAKSVVGPGDISGHGQQIIGACLHAQPGGFTYQVLDASADEDSTSDDGSPDSRVITGGQLTCDGRIHQVETDLGSRDGKHSPPVQLIVTGGRDNATARGWLIITNKPVTLH